MTTSISPPRPEFREWVDGKPDPGWALMPLTHVTKGLTAQDIIRDGHIRANQCDVFKAPRAYLFYGRPAYRVSGDGAIKVEAACPICFIFNSALLRTAGGIYAFDTGAFANRLYKHALLDEINIPDFSLNGDISRLNRLVAHVFGSVERYMDGDHSKVIDVDVGAAQRILNARGKIDVRVGIGNSVSLDLDQLDLNDFAGTTPGIIALELEAELRAMCMLNPELDGNSISFKDVAEADNLRELILSITSLPRQEERIAVIIAEAIRDPFTADVLLREYPFDRAKFINSALRQIRSTLIFSKQTKNNDASWARMVQGLIKEVYPYDKGRLLLFLAKHLGHMPMIANVLREVTRRSQSTFVVPFRHSINGYLDAVDRAIDNKEQ